MFSQQILGGKSLSVLNYDHHSKLCIKKKINKKNQPKKTVSGTMNFGSPNLTKPKKILEYNKMIQHFKEILHSQYFYKKIIDDKLLLILKLRIPLILLFYSSIVAWHLGFVMK